MRLVFLCAAAVFLARTTFSEVLIVADEFPAMQVVADRLKSEENIESRLVWQTNLPPSLAGFQAVVVYIHRDLFPGAEEAFIRYARAGGKLVCLHHSISSGKRKNKDWFSFLGISLPEGDLSKGGYKWIEGVSFELINLNPKHFIMSHKVKYPEKIDWPGRGALPAFMLKETEVYLNHTPQADRTVLMGLKYLEPKSGVTYEQQTAGWIRRTGQGTLVYLMPGHAKHDFEDPVYGRIVLNAIIYKL